MRRAEKLSISPLRYILLAQFNAPDQGYADGQVLDFMGEGCENGQLTVVEVDGTLAIVSNRCAFTAQGTPTWGDQGFYSQAITRALGRGLLGTVNVGATNTQLMFLWVDNTGIGSNDWIYGCMLNVVGDILALVYNGAGVQLEAPALATYLAATNYQFAIVLGGYSAAANGVPWRQGEDSASHLYGAAFFIKGSAAFPTWTLLWRTSQGNNSPLYAGFSNNNAAGTINRLRCLDISLEAVLQPNFLDSFTDANGVSLDVHVPDLGGPWTEQSGDWDIQGNRANISVASGGRDVATKPSSIADGLFDVVIRKTNGVDSGEFGRCLRYSDSDNFWMVQGDLTNNQVEVVERNGGVETVRASSAVALTHTTNYDVRGIADGQTIDGFLDGGNKCTHALAVLNENVTTHGIVGDGVGETFDICADFARASAVYNRTLGSV